MSSSQRAGHHMQVFYAFKGKKIGFFDLTTLKKRISAL